MAPNVVIPAEVKIKNFEQDNTLQFFYWPIKYEKTSTSFQNIVKQFSGSWHYTLLLKLNIHYWVSEQPDITFDLSCASWI